MTKPYPTITPYLMSNNADNVLQFMKAVFGATEIHMQRRENGDIMHATLQIEESMVMLSSATKDYPAMPAMLHVYMHDCDQYYNRAIAAGGTSLREPNNESHGDRMGGVQDAGGNQWWIAGPLK